VLGLLFGEFQKKLKKFRVGQKPWESETGSSMDTLPSNSDENLTEAMRRMKEALAKLE
jgi:hypothetical protein